MATYPENIRKIAKQTEIKEGLGSAKPLVAISGAVKAIETALNEGNDASTIKPPLTLTILTYDDTQDIIFEDTSAVQHTLKTAATAKLVDADGKEFPIDTIIYTTPP